MEDDFRQHKTDNLLKTLKRLENTINHYRQQKISQAQRSAKLLGRALQE